MYIYIYSINIHNKSQQCYPIWCNRKRAPSPIQDGNFGEVGCLFQASAVVGLWFPRQKALLLMNLLDLPGELELRHGDSCLVNRHSGPTTRVLTVSIMTTCDFLLLHHLPRLASTFRSWIRFESFRMPRPEFCGRKPSVLSGISNQLRQEDPLHLSDELFSSKRLGVRWLGPQFLQPEPTWEEAKAFFELQGLVFTRNCCHNLQYQFFGPLTP